MDQSNNIPDWQDDLKEKNVKRKRDNAFSHGNKINGLSGQQINNYSNGLDSKYGRTKKRKKHNANVV